MKTNELIAQLSVAPPKTCMGTPGYYAGRLGFVLVAYAMVAQYFLGFRVDLLSQLTRPMFVLEIVLLALVSVSSVVAAIMSMYPDAYQKHGVPRLTYAACWVLLILVLGQLNLPHDPGMTLPVAALEAHGLECTLCIAGAAAIPSALIFALLRKGASVSPLRSGVFAVLAAASIGCLTLRLSEANDAMLHLVSWHYAPTLLFAALGAALGKGFLKW